MSAIFNFGMSRRSRRATTTLLGLVLVVLAVGRIHVRVKTTILGYEIGELKSTEASLLEERSLLRMQLAKLTTKKHLRLMTASDGIEDIAPSGSLAAK